MSATEVITANYSDLFTDGINQDGPPDERSLLGYLVGGLEASTDDGLTSGLTSAECAAWAREIKLWMERNQ